MATILQISDCHLFADAESEIRGVRTRDTFLRVWWHALRNYPEADRIVISGDLTHDERIETYQILREIVRHKLDRISLIPGNHDERSLIRQTFPCREIPGLDRIVFAESLAGWRYLGLDSHIPGQLAGELGNAQLRWLDERLSEAAAVPTLIFLHHPPIPVNSPWLDRIMLQDASPLRDVVKSHSQIRAILCGHVHQEFSGDLEGIPVLTQPSTGVQFRPGTESLEVDSVLPGYRVLHLDRAGDWRTEIVRVAE